MREIIPALACTSGLYIFMCIYSATFHFPPSLTLASSPISPPAPLRQVRRLRSVSARSARFNSTPCGGPACAPLPASPGSNDAGNCGQAEPVVVEPAVRPAPVAAPRTGSAADVNPAPAAEHPSRGLGLVHRVRLLPRLCLIESRCVPVRRTHSHITVHVIQVKPIGLVRTHTCRAFQVLTFPGSAKGMIAVEVAWSEEKRVAEVKGLIRSSPSSTSIFPLRLSRQVVARPLGKTKSIIPRTITTGQESSAIGSPDSLTAGCCSPLLQR